jgi:hypothetical protein
MTVKPALTKSDMTDGPARLFPLLSTLPNHVLPDPQHPIVALPSSLDDDAPGAPFWHHGLRVLSIPWQWAWHALSLVVDTASS